MEAAGLGQGRQQGEAEMLLRLLERRFGGLGEKLRTMIREADAETLLRWSERVLSAASVADVLEG